MEPQILHQHIKRWVFW